MLDIVADKAGSENEVYNALFAAYSKCTDAVKNYQDGISALNSNLAQQYMLQSLMGQEIPSTKEEFDAYRQSVIDAAKESGEFIGSDADIASAIDDVLSRQSQFAGFYSDQLAQASDQTVTYAAQLSKLKDVISALKSSYDALEATRNDMSGEHGLSAETIEKLANANENYLDYLYEENGVIKLNTEAWKENAAAKMQSEMLEIQKEIDSLEDHNTALAKNSEELRYRNACIRASGDESEAMRQEITDNYAAIDKNTAQIEKNSEAITANQSKLAVYETIYGNITGNMDAYRSALANFSNVHGFIDNISKSFQTLAELQDQVAKGFTMSLDKALEFAAVYPQILDNAQVTADCQIILNKGVVNLFIQGKKAELDAQIDTKIAQLEADKAVEPEAAGLNSI